MTATDLADEIVGSPTEHDSPDEDGPTEAWVCQNPAKDNPDVICGKTFDSKLKLNGHTVGVHQMTWDGKPTPKGGRKPKDEPAVKPSPTEKKAAAQAKLGHAPKVTNENRAATYTESLAMIGMLAHVAAGRYFDDYDLQVWTAGAPGIANGLDAVGEDNAGFRRGCDLILSGGGGGSYVQLVMAVAPVAIAIFANHGVAVPREVGARYAAMIGVMSTAVPASGPQASQPPAPESGPSNQLPIEHWSYDDWRAVLFAAQGNQTAMQAMFDTMREAGVDPTQVVIPNMPGTEPFTISEEHRGDIGANGGTDQPVPAAP